MRRHKSTIDLEALRARASQTNDFPIIDHGDIALGQNNHAARLAAVFFHNGAAADQPMHMVDAARKAMQAFPSDATIHALAFANGRDRDADALRIVFAPDFVLRFFGESRELQRIVGEHHIGPGLRGAAARKRLDDRAEHVITHFIAAIEHRLADAQQARIDVIGDCLVGATTQAFGLRSARGQDRHQCFRTGDHFGRGNAEGFVLIEHSFDPFPYVSLTGFAGASSSAPPPPGATDRIVQ